MPMPQVEVSWTDAKPVKTDDGTVVLDQLAAAKAAGKVIVIWAVTNRDYRAEQIAACERFKQRMFTNCIFGELLQQKCTRLRVIVDDLPRELREQLHLSLAAPQMVIMAPDGKKLAIVDGAMQVGTATALVTEAVKFVAKQAEAAANPEE